MPTQTTNFSFDKPLVNDPIDEDLWGGQLNGNWDSIDTIVDELNPIGEMKAYAGTTAPNARWLLCDGAAVSRTTYATLFALVSTSYGIGDGSTTFNLPDYRGRAIFGLDNLGGASADRITDANADSLNNTGFGDEDISASVSGSTNSHTLTTSQIPAPTFTIGAGAANTRGDVDNSATANIASASVGSRNNIVTGALTTNYGGGGHTHGLSGATVSGSTGANLSPGIASGVIIRAL